jgi:hypothetical protein
VLVWAVMEELDGEAFIERGEIEKSSHGYSGRLVMDDGLAEQVAEQSRLLIEQEKEREKELERVRNGGTK